MGTLALAAAVAVCLGSLAAVLATRRGLATGIVLAGSGALLVGGAIPEPVAAAFSAVALVLAAYLVGVVARGADAAPGGWSGAAFVAVGAVGGAATGNVTLDVAGAWPATAAAGAAVAASVVLLWREEVGPGLAGGAVLGLVGARIAAGQLGLPLGVIGGAALDLAIVGAAASGITGRAAPPEPGPIPELDAVRGPASVPEPLHEPPTRRPNARVKPRRPRGAA